MTISEAKVLKLHKCRKKNNHTILYSFTLFFIFFPYIEIIPLPSDTQPWALFFASIIFFCTLSYYPNTKICLSLLFTLAIAFLLFLSNFSLLTFRDFFGFLSVFVFFQVFKDYYKYHYFNEHTFHFVTIIWIIVGIIQLFSPTFLTFLISASRTSIERGVTSLAVEPSAFGIILQYFLIINKFFSKNRKFDFLYTTAIFLLTQSMMSILYVVVFWGVYFLLTKTKLFFVMFGILCCLIFIVLQINYNIRAVNLTKLVFSKGILYVITTDGSISDRLGSIYYAFKGCFLNYGIPRPFGTYSFYIQKELLKTGLFYVETTSRIMSTFGSILFYEGILGMPLIIALLKVDSSIKLVDRLFIVSFLFLFYLTAIPLSFPFVGYLAALFENYSVCTGCLRKKDISLK